MKGRETVILIPLFVGVVLAGKWCCWTLVG